MREREVCEPKAHPLPMVLRHIEIKPKYRFGNERPGKKLGSLLAKQVIC